MYKVQVYQIPIEDPDGEAEIGNFVFRDDDDGVVRGFISRLLPDTCAEITFWEPEYFETLPEGMVILHDELDRDGIYKVMQEIDQQRPGWVRSILEIPAIDD